MKKTDPPKKQFKIILAGYIYPVFPLFGLVILSGLILFHTLKMGAALSMTEKLLFLGLIFIGFVFLLGGLWARTKSGVGMVAGIFNVSELAVVEARQRLSYKIFNPL